MTRVMIAVFALLCCLLSAPRARADVGEGSPLPVWHVDASGCGFRIQGDEQLVAKATVAVNPDGSRSCIWYLHAPDDQRIALSFTRMPGSDNRYRRIQVFEGDGTVALATHDASVGAVVSDLPNTVIVEVTGAAQGHGLFASVHRSR